MNASFQVPALWKQSRALSLMELLVVVTILAVLAALLLGGLRRASEISKRVGCVAHYRALYGVINQYANDHENLYPNSRYGGKAWVGHVAAYLPEKATYVRPATGRGITYCPATTGDGEPPYKRDAKTWRCDYNVNANVFAYDVEGKELRYRPTVPASIVLMWDGPGGINHSESYYLRHQGRFQVLFGDGHTELLPNATSLANRWKR